MIILYLTCASPTEAKQITDALLNAKLVACVRQMTVSSKYWWDDTINSDDEILLMMESVEDKFEAINDIVSELHSYDEYVLTATQVHKTTHGVEEWLKKSIQG